MNPGQDRRPATASRVWKRIRTALIVVLGVIAIAVVFDLGTASPRLCVSCHEMESRAHSWGQSAHGTVACVKCHQTPTAWYELPQRLVDRGRLLGRDVSAHRAGTYDDPVETRASGVAPIQDSVCLQCHDPNRKATSGYRILINHAEHAKRNGSCVSCHVRTAHPEKTRGRALTLMAQCFTCHGKADKPEASAKCGACHPSGYELLPASHKAERWEKGRHGTIAQEDVNLCGMCHEKRLCDDCHGIQMPHPAKWAEGRAGHGPAAKSRLATCVRCHNQKPDMCTMCHHTKYNPVMGTWIAQHNVKVKEDGAAYCMECHGPTYCVDCHIGRQR